MTYSNIDKTTNTKLAARRAAEQHPLRWRANKACLWGLCSNAACRRAHECRGNPHDCVARYAPLVPEEVHEGVRIMAEYHGLSFDELRADYPLEMDAVRDWSDLVLESTWRQR